MEELNKLIGKTVKSIKDLTEERQDAFQITFDDGSIFVVRSHAHGYEIEAETLDIDIYEP